MNPGLQTWIQRIHCLASICLRIFVCYFPCWLEKEFITTGNVFFVFSWGLHQNGVGFATPVIQGQGCTHPRRGPPSKVIAFCRWQRPSEKLPPFLGIMFDSRSMQSIVPRAVSKPLQSAQKLIATRSPSSALLPILSRGRVPLLKWTTQEKLVP